MDLHEARQLIQGELLVNEENKDTQIERAYAVDLLSDLLALADEPATLITGTISPQVVRVAHIMNVVAIVFVRGKRPPRPVLDYAQQLKIPVLFTRKTMFETCGLLYSNGVRPCRIRPVPSFGGSDDAATRL